MDPAEISRRLKAARWLAGGVNDKDQPRALDVNELAQRAPLPDNNITANRIREIEQLEAKARPMELDKIAEALGMPADWFTVEKVAPITPNTAVIRDALSRLTEQVAGLAATQQEPETGTPDTSDSNGNSGEVPRAPAQGTGGTA